MGGTSNLQRGEGESFYTCPPKINCWKLASKKPEHPILETGTSGIWKLAIGAHLPNPDPPIWETGSSDFTWFSEMWSVCGHCVSPISLG
jgi:hypothetical protein